MTALESIGFCFVAFFCCCGMAGVGYLAVIGAKDIRARTSLRALYDRNQKEVFGR